MEITSADKTLLDFLKKFDTLALLFQNKDAIKELTYKVIEEANADNLRYLELRFAPHYMQSKSKLTADEIVDAVLDGIKDAKSDFPDIRVEPMLIAVRHLPPEKVKEIVDLDIKKGIGSIDLASDELHFPPELFCREFKEAKDKGLDITIHAGEARGADSVKSAISCGAGRIGHGVRIIEDPVFMDEVKRLGIPLEICPTSNVQTGAVPALKDHPIRKFYDSGLNVTVNTDDPGVSGIDLSHEYLLLMKEFGFSMEDLEKIILNGVFAAFLPPDEKEELKKKFLAELESLKQVQGENF